jgi:signal transduction histidine kinase
VNQVLDMAKIESGHAQWQTEQVDLCALIRQAVATTSELLHERQIAVDLHLPATSPALMADPDRLTQVLLNLLSNAAKFVPQSSGRIGVSLRNDDSGVTVAVQDNGPGVAPLQQALIFDKFRQGGDAANRPQGTGLGLPISRQIVEHFGGRLWLESSPPNGACFLFFLPLNPLASPENTKKGDKP